MTTRARSGYDVMDGRTQNAGGERQAYPVDGRSRAYIEVLLLRSAWRAAKDAEAQIAHWLLDGSAGATHADLVEARDRARLARKALTHAQRTYTREANHQANNRRVVLVSGLGR